MKSRISVLFVLFSLLGPATAYSAEMPRSNYSNSQIGMARACDADRVKDLRQSVRSSGSDLKRSNVARGVATAKVVK